VKQFQADHGLHSNTNEVGQMTLNALEHPQHPPAPSLGDIQNGTAKLQAGQQGPAVADIQQMLNMKTTGVYDGATQAAVEKFKQNHGLHSDSLEVGQQTLQAMEQAQEAQRAQRQSRAAMDRATTPRTSAAPPQAQVSQPPVQTDARRAERHSHAAADKNVGESPLRKAERSLEAMVPHLPTAKDARAVYDAGAAKMGQLKKSAQDVLDKLPKQAASPQPARGDASVESVFREGMKKGADYVGDHMKQATDAAVNTMSRVSRAGRQAVQTGQKAERAVQHMVDAGMDRLKENLSAVPSALREGEQEVHEAVDKVTNRLKKNL
jgi:peptidoglycan hydrolase-like protein with peptidoglycan-binding domain